MRVAMPPPVPPRPLVPQQRSHARREDALLDRLLHATGKTWTPPPADEHVPPTDVTVPHGWTASPEQLA